MRKKLMRKAFTLLEMLLTLAMCVVLMILVSSAMTFYVREMAQAETQFRQSQVASAVLQMIEDDLRMTLTTRPVDTQALADILSSAAEPLSQLGLSGASGGNSSEDESSAEDLGLGAQDEELASESLGAESLDVSLGGTVLQSPGLIGNADQLQIDVSRLPRLEESVIDPTLAISNGRLLDRPSDIKTISYFVEAPGMGTSVDALEELAANSGFNTGNTTSNLDSGGGLVRRELDRAISTHAATSGGLARLGSAGELLSPEVASISFEYFDGINWLAFYSSDDTGFLPPAIRVTLQINGEDGSTESIRTYTHVIRLPMSYPEDATIEEDTVEEDTGLGMEL